MVFYRVPPLRSNPIAQFGAAWRPEVRREVGSWGSIKDDHPEPWVDQVKGALGFGGNGKDSRTAHMWIARQTFSEVHPSLGKNAWDTPVAVVLKGLEVVDKIKQVGDTKPWGNGPDFSKMHQDPTFVSAFPGKYLTENYPGIDFFKSCRVAG